MAEADGMTAVLEIRGLGLGRGGQRVLDGVDLAVDRGEVVGLMGLSGAGKSTILRAIAGLETFDAGTIRVDEVTVAAGTSTADALRLLHQRVGMVFQFHYLFEHLTATENVWLAPVHARGVARGAAEARARGLLAELGVGHRADALPRELSGGEAQRVAIARALAVDPPVLLLDEPTASLDPARRGELAATLRALAASGRTLFVTSHDDDFVRDVASRVLVLAEGVVVESGRPEDVLSNPRHPATKRLLAAGQR
ncbi:MAG: amino acid ABC transporter ATP-binding protein [Vicinamibacterales bacterium]